MRPSLASPQKTFISPLQGWKCLSLLQRCSWCWRESSKGSFPSLCPQPSSRSCCPTPSSCLTPALAQGQPSAGLRKPTAHPGALCSREGAMRWGMEPNTFSQPANNYLLAASVKADGPGGCRALPCAAHPWLQPSFEPQCQTGECPPASTQGKGGCSCEILFFFLYAGGWQAVMELKK